MAKFGLNCGCFLESKGDAVIIAEGQHHSFIWCEKHGKKILKMYKEGKDEETEKFILNLITKEMKPKMFTKTEDPKEYEYFCTQCHHVFTEHELDVIDWMPNPKCSNCGAYHKLENNLQKRKK